LATRAVAQAQEHVGRVIGQRRTSPRGKGIA
jgi:hypothetical protein